MSNCRKYKDLIEKVVDGTISDSELFQLKAHTDTCPACREEVDGFNLMQEVITEAFCSPKGARQAGAQVLDELSTQPHRQSRNMGRRWRPIAAGFLLAIGMTVGFGLGTAGFGTLGNLKLAAEVRLRVLDIEGTVLVKHTGSDMWQTLETLSTIRLGDTFHSTAMSGFVLGVDKESTIKVNQNSMLVLKSYNGQTQFFLEHGECTAALESPHGRFFIETPHGRVEALGTEFTVTVE